VGRGGRRIQEDVGNSCERVSRPDCLPQKKNAARKRKGGNKGFKKEGVVKKMCGKGGKKNGEGPLGNDVSESTKEGIEHLRVKDPRLRAQERLILKKKTIGSGLKHNQVGPACLKRQH